MRGGRGPFDWLLRSSVVAVLLLMTVDVGVAPATVAEQRIRLPPAAECQSEVEGRWKALIWTPYERAWYEFVAEIHRAPGSATELTGVIRVETWLGGPDRSEPGPCTGGRHYRGTMPATGSYVDGQVRFGGVRFEIGEVFCGAFGNDYYTDQFTGKIEKERQEFQSVNNDGGNAVDEPTVFRRIGCLEDEPPTP